MKRADLVPLDVIPLATHESWMDVLELKTEADAVGADKAHLAVSALYDSADAKRKALKRPFLDGVQYYDNQWKAARGPLERVLNHLKGLLASYEEATRAKRVAQIEKQAKKLKDRTRANALVAVAKEESVDLPYGKWLDNYEFSIDDWRLVPPELLKFDEVRAKKMLKAGVTEIPGVHVRLVRKRSATVPKEGV